MTLLGPADAAPFRITNSAGQSSFLFTGDHAGNAVPAKLARLGLSDADLARHIAIDIGVSALGVCLAGLLDACFIEQHYSRLVVDCNRHADAGDAMPAHSDGTLVPGNQAITPNERAGRLGEIYEPYHHAISEALAVRNRAGRRTVLVALHSFTPCLVGGPTRPWDVGVLYGGGEVAFAQSVLAGLRAYPGICVGDNEPYRMDATDYSVPCHAFAARLPYVEIEVNQRRLAERASIEDMAALLADVLQAKLLL